MMQDRILIRSADFSLTPGGRWRKQSKWSGQEFREDVLAPALQKAEHVVVDLDGPVGFATAFLEEAFGGLVRQFGPQIADRISVKAIDHPGRARRAQDYLRLACEEALKK